MRVPDTFIRNFFEPLWDLYEGSVRLRTLRHLRQTQWQSSGKILSATNKKLFAMVCHAVATSPFYRSRFAEAGIDPTKVAKIEDLSNLPLLTKDDIRAHTDDILSTAFKKQDLALSKTGGSTGVALQIYCDRKGVEKRAGAALRADEWSGWVLGQPLAAIWGNPPTPKTLKNKLRRWVKDRIIYLDTMRIDDQAIAQFLGQWRQMNPGLLYGHAHSIFILCEILKDRGIALSPRGIVATSMMLIEQERQVIEEVCGIKVTNRYGCEEVSLIACECEQHHGMHLNTDHNIVEFLRDDGTPCAPGEDGRIVVTELVNFGMPMIRYEVGDRGVPSDRICPCGRGLPLMEHVTGRVADFLVATDGHKVAGISIIENTLTRLPGIKQMQVVQEEALRLQVNLVPGPEYGPETEVRLVASLQEYLGTEVGVQVTQVARIPQEESGKYRFTICRI
ncbi:MAG: phenylacetate--CoA ligase family protein [Deltaproteobacteria bacterium]|nr:MAG: phenylacetate--CoA ligase family protein [Deltaproteobacteria bacterium]